MRGESATMSPAQIALFRADRLPRPRPLLRRGLTLVELLVASLILAVSLMALVATWFNMLTATIDTDDRGAAYECARIVLERAHINGYTVYQYNVNLPTTISQPGNAALSAWSSPNIARYRYFSADLSQELLASNADTLPAAPAESRYLAVTQYDSSPNAPHSHLSLMTVKVTVYFVRSDGSIGSELYQMQTCLALGGV